MDQGAAVVFVETVDEAHALEESGVLDVDLGAVGSPLDQLVSMMQTLNGGGNRWTYIYTADPAGGQMHRPQSWNRYAYALNNPLKWVDPTGETVSLADLSEEQRELLLENLNEFTGNTYGVNDSLELVLLEVGANSSATATEFLGTLIGSSITFGVSSGSKSRWIPDTTNVEVAFDLTTDYGKVAPRTLNTGSAMIHELFHATTGLQDTPDGNPGTPISSNTKWTGPVVDSVNEIRIERGLPTRAGYMVDRTMFSRKGERMYFDNPKKPRRPFVVNRWRP